MSKTIVTHQHPDLDAIMGVWLLIRHDQSRYGDAKLGFVPSSTTYKNEPVDSNPKVVHVDVGFGEFDHHQEGRYGTCASELIWKKLIEERLVQASDEALKAMVEHAREIDTFEDREWVEASLPRFAFTLSEIIPALHRLQIYDNEAVVRMVMGQLDGVYQKLKDWYKAIQEIEAGVEFGSKWGKGVAVETGADDVHKVAQRMGYAISVVANPQTGYLGIKTSPGTEESLRELYDKMIEVDGEEKWYFHNSGQMVLHGSSKGQKPEPSDLSVDMILKMMEEIGGVS